MVANPRAMLYFRLEPWEADMLPLMDGTRTAGEIAVARLEEEGDLDASGATELIQILEVGGFLEPVPVGFQEGLARALDPLTAAQRKIRTFMKTLSIEWTGADRFVRWWYRRILHPFYLPVRDGDRRGDRRRRGSSRSSTIERSGRYTLGSRSAPVESLILLGLGFVLTFFHELGHASTIIHFGRRVKSAGFMIYFGSPSFFVEASDSLMLERRQRITQSFAGPFAELILAGASTLVLALFPDAAFAALLYKFALINYFVIFLNLIPLLELDGYWILTDLIQVPDLRPRSLEFFQHDLWHKLRTRDPVDQAGDRPRPLRRARDRRSRSSRSTRRTSSGSGSSVAWCRRCGTVASARGCCSCCSSCSWPGPAIRGLIQLVRPLFRRVRAIVRGLVFRAESKWRVEAAELDRRTAGVRRPAGRDR